MSDKRNNNTKRDVDARDEARDVNRDAKRIPLHKQNVLEAQNRSGYKRMWIVEHPGEVDKYMMAGWAVVQDAKAKTHDGQSQVESQVGTAVRRVANKDPHAPARYQVLMEIPLELYEADQRDEQALIDEKERSFDKTGVHRQANGYGQIGITRG